MSWRWRKGGGRGVGGGGREVEEEEDVREEVDGRKIPVRTLCNTTAVKINRSQ